MQVISGLAKGIKLSVPKGNDVRPTSSRTRTSLFSSINEFNGLTIVDLFAGSGSLGLEAASRGAKKVIFIEQSKKHCKFIEDNIEKVKKAGVETEFHVIHGDATKSLASISRLTDIVNMTFSDPPYPISEEMFGIVTKNKHLAAYSENMLIWEVPDFCENKMVFLKPGLWKVAKTRKFGRTEFLFCKPKSI